MKVKKVLKVLIIFLVVFFLSNNIVFAADDSYLDATQFENVDDSGTLWEAFTGLDDVDDGIKGVIEKILGIVRVIAVGIAIIMLIVIGVKYMTSSIDNKVHIKEQLPNYIIGAVILFASSGVLQLITILVADILPEG